jgi:hypothetical protein
MTSKGIKYNCPATSVDTISQANICNTSLDFLTEVKIKDLKTGLPRVNSIIYVKTIAEAFKQVAV